MGMKKKNKWFNKKFLVSLLGKAIGGYLMSQGQVQLGTAIIAGSGTSFNIGQGYADGKDPNHDTESEGLNSRKILSTVIQGAAGAYMASQGYPTEGAVLFTSGIGSYVAGETLAETGETYRDV